MKKKDFKLTLENKTHYSLLTLIIFSFILTSIFAFGTSSPSTFGHSAGELDFSSGVSGNAIFNDNVGIGVLNPQAKLDINGEVKIGNSGLSCSSSTEGSVRYNSVSNVMEFCDGILWNAFSGCSNSGTQEFTTPGDYVFIIDENMKGCNFTIEISGARGNSGGRGDPGAYGGKAIFTIIPAATGSMNISVGSSGGGGSSGSSGWVSGGNGGGASLISLNGNLLAISGGGGGGGGGYSSWGGAGGAGNDAGARGGTGSAQKCGAGAYGGNNGVGGIGSPKLNPYGQDSGDTGANYLNGSLTAAIGGTGGDSTCGTYCSSGGGGGSGYGGGGGGCGEFGSAGTTGAGGGGFLNISIASLVLVDVSSSSNGYINLSWSE